MQSSFTVIQCLSQNQTKFDRSNNWKDILNTFDDKDIGCFLEVDLTYPDKLKEKNIKFTVLSWK